MLLNAYDVCPCKHIFFSECDIKNSKKKKRKKKHNWIKDKCSIFAVCMSLLNASCLTLDFTFKLIEWQEHIYYHWLSRSMMWGSRDFAFKKWFQLIKTIQPQKLQEKNQEDFVD